MLEIILLFTGIILGVLVSYFLIHKTVESKYKALLETWKSSSIIEIRKQTLDKSRAVLKGKISEQIVSLLPEFKYHSADARFIGNPIDYVIFDGYSDDHPIDIVFMDVKKGKHARLTRQEKRIKEAVDNKRVKWRTLNLE